MRSLLFTRRAPCAGVLTKESTRLRPGLQARGLWHSSAESSRAAVSSVGCRVGESQRGGNAALAGLQDHVCVSERVWVCEPEYLRHPPTPTLPHPRTPTQITLRRWGIVGVGSRNRGTPRRRARPASAENWSRNACRRVRKSGWACGLRRSASCTRNSWRSPAVVPRTTEPERRPRCARCADIHNKQEIRPCPNQLRI